MSNRDKRLRSAKDNSHLLRVMGQLGLLQKLGARKEKFHEVKLNKVILNPIIDIKVLVTRMVFQLRFPIIAFSKSESQASLSFSFPSEK